MLGINLHTCNNAEFIASIFKFDQLDEKRELVSLDGWENAGYFYLFTVGYLHCKVPQPFYSKQETSLRIHILQYRTDEGAKYGGCASIQCHLIIQRWGLRRRRLIGLLLVLCLSNESNAACANSTRKNTRWPDRRKDDALTVNRARRGPDIGNCPLMEAKTDKRGIALLSVFRKRCNFMKFAVWLLLSIVFQRPSNQKCLL